MMAHLLYGLLLVLVSMTTPCQGSKIVFTSTPAEISEGFTKVFTLRCALEDDTNATNTASSLLTIIIRKADGTNQKEVAKLVSGQAATPGAVAAGASVVGDISKTEGYLQVSWSNPGQPQAGGYNCEIVALKADGFNMKLKSNVQVESTSQTVADLTRLISKANDEIEALKNKVSNLKPYNAEDIEALKNKVSNLKPPHADEGIVDCGASTTWGANLQSREAVREVRFRVPYERVPQVVVVPIIFDDESHTRISVGIRDLTPNGFKVVCGTWSSSLIHGIWVRWTSSVA